MVHLRAKSMFFWGGMNKTMQKFSKLMQSLLGNATILRENTHFCERKQCFLWECRTFTKQAKVFQINAKFLGECKYFAREQFFVSKYKVPFQSVTFKLRVRE